MKKLTYLLGLMLVAGLIFTSCTDDEDDPIDETPTMNFKGGEFQPGIDFVDGDATLPVNSKFYVGITAQTNSGKELETIEVTSKFENENPVLYQEDINDDSYDANLEFDTNIGVGDEDWIFTIEDKPGNTKQLSFTITTELVGDSVRVSVDVTMGSYNDQDFGSFYASSTDMVYFKAEAENNQDIIDLAFFKGTNTQNTIAAPAAQNVITVFNIGGWATLNDTQVEISSITAADFDAIGDTYVFPDFTGTGNEVNNVAIDDVLLFETVDGKTGLIKVNSFPTKGDKINIDIKIQK